MTMFYPEVSSVRGSSFTRCNGAWERSRLEWRLGDAGDPAQLAAAFLATHNLALPTDQASSSSNTKSHNTRPVCGAAMYLSAAASASMHGVSAGASSPAHGVPDLVVVVYAHGPVGPRHGSAERPREPAVTATVPWQ